jgi:hypothetical protein
MSDFNWDDGTEEMKETSVAGKNTGMQAGAATGAVLSATAYNILFEGFQGLFMLLGSIFIGMIIGAYIGGLLGHLYDMWVDKKNKDE